MSKGLQRGLAALVVLPLLYALLGFFVLPWAGLKLANRLLGEYARVPARLERIEFNPFSLELTLYRLQLGAPDDEQLGFARLYADLQGDSLWRGELHLRALRIEQPHVELRLAADGSLNLRELFKNAAPQEEPPSRAAQPFPLRIDLLQLSGGRLGFADRRPADGVAFRYERLDLEARDLATRGPASAELRISASGPDGGELAGQGRLGLAPLRAEGSLTVGAIPLAGWWPYLRASLPLTLQQGSARLSGAYRLQLSDGLHLQLNDARVQLDGLQLADAAGHALLDLVSLTASSNLALSPGTPLRLDGARLQLSGLELHRPAPQPLLRLASLELSDAQLDLAARRIAIAQLHSRGLEAWAAREADGTLDWQTLLQRQLAALLEPAEHAAADGRAAPASTPDGAATASAAQASAASQANQAAAPAAATPPAGPWRI